MGHPCRLEGDPTCRCGVPHRAAGHNDLSSSLPAKGITRTIRGRALIVGNVHALDGNLLRAPTLPRYARAVEWLLESGRARGDRAPSLFNRPVPTASWLSRCGGEAWSSERGRRSTGRVWRPGWRSARTPIFARVTVQPAHESARWISCRAGRCWGGTASGTHRRQGRHYRPQRGGLSIGDGVEIGANVTIDRGSAGDTVVGAGTKIDNLVHIAHNVSIGRNAFIVAQVGIAGSTSVGDHVVIAGQAGVVGHVTIGDGTTRRAGGRDRDVRPTRRRYPASPMRQLRATPSLPAPSFRTRKAWIKIERMKSTALTIARP